MYTLETGLFPFAAIVVGAMFTLIYFGVVRLKCVARWAIGFIFTAMIIITVFSIVMPVRWVELDTTTEVQVQPDYSVMTPVKVAGSTTSQTIPTLKAEVKEPIPNVKLQRESQGTYLPSSVRDGAKASR